MKKMILTGIAFVIIVFLPRTESLAGGFSVSPNISLEIGWGQPYYDDVWVDGYWERRRGHWVWIEGYWKNRYRPRIVWVPGHWERRRGHWVWIEGYKERRGSKAYWEPRKWEKRYKYRKDRYRDRRQGSRYRDRW